MPVDVTRAAPAPGSFADLATRPRGWVCAGALTLIGAFPLIDSWTPAANYMPLAYVYLYGLPAFAAAVFLRIAILAVFSTRFTHGGWREARSWALGFVGVCALGAAVMLDLPIRMAFLLSYTQFDAARSQIAAGQGWQEERWVGLYPSYRADHPFGNDIVAIYTEPPTVFNWGTSHGQGLPNSGEGFYHLPPGLEMPPYNRGREGPLVGGWYWFVTD